MNAPDDLSTADAIELLDDAGAVLARAAVLMIDGDRLEFEAPPAPCVEAVAVRVLDHAGRALGTWPTARGAGAQDLARRLIERFAVD